MALNVSTLRIIPEFLSLSAEIDEFKGAWRTLGRIAPAGVLNPRSVRRGQCR